MRDTAGHGADAERVERGINFNRSAQFISVLFEKARELPGCVLPLQLIAVRSGDNTKAFAFAADAVFFNYQVFPDCEGDSDYFFYHNKKTSWS